MIALILLLLPIIFGFLCFLMPAKPAKALALVTALGTMVTALVIGSQGNTLGVSTEFQMDFFPILGSTLHLGMDMLTLAMLLLNGLVFSLIFYYLHNRLNWRWRYWYRFAG